MAFWKFRESEIPSRFNPDLRSLTLDCFIIEYLPRQQLHVPARFTGLIRAIGYEKPVGTRSIAVLSTSSSPKNSANICQVGILLF